MAFYPDELSPIDRTRSLGKQADPLPDIGPLKNRRQWKSLVLGKKDMGMNNFATITEEKEEEISSEGSQGGGSDANGAGAFVSGPGVVTNKKIIFPKPRKYITSRVSDRDRKEEISLRSVGGATPFASLEPSPFPAKEFLDSEISIARTELSATSGGSKPNVPDPKMVPRSATIKEFLTPAQDFVQNYALNETPIESQWNEAFSEGAGLANWSRQEKMNLLKVDAEQLSKFKPEEKRKSSGSSKSSAVTDVGKRDAKGGKKKGGFAQKKSPKVKEEIPSTSTATGVSSGRKGKQKAEKGKALNMKEVVNVYKNLAYGSKEEIKSFVENLSFVKDESKVESDKNLLSMMNLKALENKIKNFTKKSGKGQEGSTPKEKKTKGEKPAKKNRKAHIERLARHKVVKVPALLGASGSTDGDGTSDQKEKRSSAKSKEPWKYVGMESVLDKTYFVYPAYPPSVNLKNSARSRKSFPKGTEKPIKSKKDPADVPASDPVRPGSKVKGPQVVLKPNPPRAGSGAPPRRPDVPGSPSSKAVNRPSAMTVCTVKFRPTAGPKPEEPAPGASDHSLLVYLHGTKAIHVKSPYSDKQFSRVKFFRKDEKGMPLIKGVGRRSPAEGRQTVSVRNISLPERLTGIRSLELLDFDEDIQNITDFLRSQDSSDRRRLEECQGGRRSEREWPKESPKESECAAPRRQRHHRHRGSPPPPSQGAPALSPDSIVHEISKNIHHLQYLPDTEDNRKMIGRFFDELDQRIEASRNGNLPFQKFPSSPNSDSFAPLPILGY